MRGSTQAESVNHASLMGQKNTIETKDSSINIGYFFNNRGTCRLVIKLEFTNFITSITSDRDAWRLSTEFNHRTETLWASYQQRDYEKNLPAINQPHTLQRAIKDIALSQAYALSKKELTLGYEWLLEKFDLSTDYNRIISVVDNHRNHYAGISTRFYIEQNLTTSLRVEQEINNHFTVLTAGIGITW